MAHVSLPNFIVVCNTIQAALFLLCIGREISKSIFIFDLCKLYQDKFLQHISLLQLSTLVFYIPLSDAN